MTYTNLLCKCNLWPETLLPNSSNEFTDSVKEGNSWGKCFQISKVRVSFQNDHGVVTINQCGASWVRRACRACSCRCCSCWLWPWFCSHACFVKGGRWRDCTSPVQKSRNKLRTTELRNPVSLSHCPKRRGLSEHNLQKMLRWNHTPLVNLNKTFITMDHCCLNGVQSPCQTHICGVLKDEKHLKWSWVCFHPLMHCYSW